MNSFTLNTNKEKLLELMQSFYSLTQIKLALFDTDGYEIISYPENHCEFCSRIRSTPAGDSQCIRSNNQSFARCQITGQLEVFRCHAGLIEATVPLIDNDSVIGYIMFGQISDDAGNTQVSYKSTEQILSASKILEACTFYVLFRELVSVRRNNFVDNLNDFLLKHLSEDLSVDRLTREFHISKNKLYESCNRYIPVGIAKHIKMLRIEEAKRLLKETDMSIDSISEKVGFDDYNYFCRVFKKEVGMSAGKYRRL